MKEYTITFSKGAAKELRSLTKEVIRKIIEIVKELAIEPRPAGCKKLVGEKENLWRVRSGDYRVIYSVDDSLMVVDIRRVGHRKEIYNR